MIIVNGISLIGDFLGTIPALIHFTRNWKGSISNVKIICNPCVAGLVSLLPEDVQTKIVFDEALANESTHLDRTFWAERYEDFEMPVCLDIQRAFSEATGKRIYMGGAYYSQLLSDVKEVKAELIIKPPKVVRAFDYVISPFSRSLPESQKVSREAWQAFVDAHADRDPEAKNWIEFALIGTTKYDDPNFIKGPNVTPFFGRDWNQVGNLLLSTKALLSVVTGTSHLAFHLGVNNILFSNQGFAWGTNPKAIADKTIVSKHIPTITAADITGALKLLN